MQSNDVYPIHESQSGTKIERKKDFNAYVDLVPIPHVFIVYVQILVLFYGAYPKTFSKLVQALTMVFFF